MIGSQLDKNQPPEWDLAGYFIVKGAQRIITCLQQIGGNFIFYNKDQTKTSVNIYWSVAGYRFLNKVVLSKARINLTFQPINTKLNALAVVTYLGYNDKQIIQPRCKQNHQFKLLLLSYL